jgi:hypothetical protein
VKRAFFLALAVAACKPDLGPGDAILTTTRILAVKAEPAEAKPGTSATYTALVATPGGAMAGAPLGWAFCTAPKPVGENDVVSTACTSDPSSLVPAGRGPSIVAATPSDACTRFGPNAPPGGFRPRDPDVTGGYYQPLRVDLDETSTAFVLARITCDLANAPADAVEAFGHAYVANANPALLPLSVDGAPIAGATFHAGVAVTLTVSWPATSAETYAYYDAATSSVTTKRESLRVAWTASGGALATESTGRAEDDAATSTDDVWTPPAAGPAHLWIVLRDSRGGVDFATYDVTVAP